MRQCEIERELGPSVFTMVDSSLQLLCQKLDKGEYFYPSPIELTAALKAVIGTSLFSLDKVVYLRKHKKTGCFYWGIRRRSRKDKAFCFRGDQTLWLERFLTSHM